MGAQELLGIVTSLATLVAVLTLASIALYRLIWKR